MEKKIKQKEEESNALNERLKAIRDGLEANNESLDTFVEREKVIRERYKTCGKDERKALDEEDDTLRKRCLETFGERFELLNKLNAAAQEYIGILEEEREALEEKLEAAENENRQLKEKLEAAENENYAHASTCNAIVDMFEAIMEDNRHLKKVDCKNLDKGITSGKLNDKESFKADAAPELPPTPQDATRPTEEQVIEFMRTCLGRTLRDDVARKQARRFLNYNDKHGWKNRAGEAIAPWEKCARGWMRKQEGFKGESIYESQTDGMNRKTSNNNQ